jgi:hypothetical protein
MRLKGFIILHILISSTVPSPSSSRRYSFFPSSRARRHIRPCPSIKFGVRFHVMLMIKIEERDSSFEKSGSIRETPTRCTQRDRLMVRAVNSNFTLSSFPLSLHRRIARTLPYNRHPLSSNLTRFEMTHPLTQQQ